MSPSRGHIPIFFCSCFAVSVSISPALRCNRLQTPRSMYSQARRGLRDEPTQATLTLPQAAQMVVAWSLVHGFAMLLLDDRLKQLIAKLPAGVDEMAFLPAIL